MEVTLDERALLGKLLFGELCAELLLQRIELVAALVLGRTFAGNGVSLVVGFGDHLLAKGLVVGLVAIGALHVFAQLLAQFHLGLAVLFDFGVRKLDRFKHLGFRNLFHFAFDHQDVVVGGAYHDVQVGVGILREGGIDHQLAVNAGNAHLGDRAGERHVRYGQRRRSGQSGQRVGHNVLVGRDEVDLYEYLGVEIRREQRAQRAVDQSRNQDFVIRRAGLTLEEASGETARSGVFLFVFDRQRHEIAVGFGLLGGNYGGQQHRVPLFHNDRPVGLLR